MSSLLAVLLLMLIPASSSMDVAPQDADPFCLTEASTSNMLITDPRQVVLLDTLHYRPQELVTLFGGTQKWISLKFLDGVSSERWLDFSQGQGCSHQLLSCFFTIGPQNNWLITQYINISNPSVTDLNVDATYATNVNQGACTGSCVQNVPIHFYWTNNLNETERNDNSNYGGVAGRLVHIGNNGERESANLVVPVSQGFNGAYLALVDEGTCVYISRLVVSYTVCPAQNLDLISYPQIVAPTVNNATMVPVTCVEGASTIEPQSLECNIGGIWGSIDSPCQCDPGYQLNGTGLNASCEACPPKHFKSSRSNTEMCRPCPGLSSSPVGNQTVCMCDTGYYRAPSDSPSDDCTAPPTAPRNLNTSVLSGILITLTWLPPINTGGRSDLRYDVSYVEGTRNITQSSTVNNITLTSLIPLTNYFISVEAVNGVSEQVDNPAERTAYINVTTPQPPCPPEHFKSSRNNTVMCRPCPGLSSSPVGNQTVCMCDTGYYRAPSDSPSDDCTGPPTAPRNLNTSFLNGTMITLTWLPPINTGGRSDLRYDVSYVEGTTNITQSSTVNNITLSSLIPLTNYFISVEAVNGVSEQVGNPAERTAYINVTTPRQSLPVACPPEHFKSSRSNTEMCRPCPGLSSSPVGNQTVCMCDTGYYRAPSDSPSDACTAPPTAPRNLNTSFLSGILITLTWLPPINTGGRSDLRYDVSYVEGTRKITQSSTVNNIILTSLIPLTRYLISVEAVNGVSDQVGNPAERTAYINVTTPRQPPSETQMVTLIGNTLSWQEPANLYGEILLRFEILAARSNDSSRAEVIHVIEPPTTSFSLDELRPLLPAGQSFVWVRAVSTGGDGVIVASGISITGRTAEMSASVGIIIGASAGAILCILGIALLLVICLIILIVIARKRAKQEKYVQALYSVGEDSAAASKVVFSN